MLRRYTGDYHLALYASKSLIAFSAGICLARSLRWAGKAPKRGRPAVSQVRQAVSQVVLQFCTIKGSCKATAGNCLAC